MPLTAAAGTAIAGIAGALGSGAQMLMTGKMNRKTRSWNEKMMQRQRDWALSDWEMQNAYNSPAAQMARLKEAGLNPNLVYGGGGATQDSGNVRSTEATPWRPETPNVGSLGDVVGRTLADYYNIQQQKAQTDLIKTQTTVAEQDQILKQIRQTAEILGIMQGNFKLGQDMKLAPYNLQLAKEKVYSVQQSIMESLARMGDISWKQNIGQQRLEMDKDRLTSDMSTAVLQRSIMRASMNKTAKEISQINQNIANMKKTGEYQDMINTVQKKLTDSNLTTGDSGFYKTISAVLDQLSKEIVGKRFWENLEVK